MLGRPSRKGTSNSVPSVGEEQLTAADPPERIDQSIEPDNTLSAGQAVPNLRSLHRQLPSPGLAPRAPSAQADSKANSDTCIIPMVQLGSAGVRQVTSPGASPLHRLRRTGVEGVP